MKEMKAHGLERYKLKQEITGSRGSMHGYILTYSGFKGRTFANSGFSTEGTLNLHEGYCAREG